MNFTEVVKGLRMGKRFRRNCWENFSIWIGNTWRGEGITDGDQEYNFCVDDFEANDWVEV